MMSSVRRELLNQDEATDLLGPHLESLNSCIVAAWSRWQEHPDYATASKRTRASVVYDYITDAVEKQFEGAPGIRMKWKYGSLHMSVDDSAIIKFKKFRGRRLRTSGIATNARSAFLAQEGVLDGMVVTNLVVGYLLDELELGPEKVAVACPIDHGNLWTLDLGQAGGDGTVTTIGSGSPGEGPDAGGTTIKSTKVPARDNTAVNEE